MRLFRTFFLSMNQCDNHARIGCGLECFVLISRIIAALVASVVVLVCAQPVKRCSECNCWSPQFAAVRVLVAELLELRSHTCSLTFSISSHFSTSVGLAKGGVDYNAQVWPLLLLLLWAAKESPATFKTLFLTRPFYAMFVQGVATKNTKIIIKYFLEEIPKNTNS